MFFLLFSIPLFSPDRARHRLPSPIGDTIPGQVELIQGTSDPDRSNDPWKAWKAWKWGGYTMISTGNL